MARSASRLRRVGDADRVAGGPLPRRDDRPADRRQQLGEPVAAGVAERLPRPQCQPVGVGLDGGHDRQALGGEPVRRPASRRSVSSLGGGVPRRRRPSRGPAAATRGVLRPAAAASTCAPTPSISRCSSAALCPSPRCSRSVVSACHSARCGSSGHRQRRAFAAASGRPGSVDRGRRGRAPGPRPRPPRRSRPLLAEHPADRGVDPGQPRLAGRPPASPPSQTAGTRRATNAGAKL